MRDFFQKAIFFRLSVALVIGILLFEFLEISPIFYLIPLFLGIILMLIFVFGKNIKFRYRFDWFFGVGFLLIIICFGFFRSFQNAENQNFDFKNKSGVFSITLTDFPSEKANSMLAYATVNSFSDSEKTENCHANIVIYIAKDSAAQSLKTGDKLLISTLLSMPEKKGNPDEFDYAKYLSRKNIAATGYVSAENWQKIGEEHGFSLLMLAQRCRLQLLDIYRNMNISGDEFGVVAALTLGYTDALSPELRDSFSATGASHILSVSGMHVAVIFMVINYLLFFLDKDEKMKRAKALIIIVFLWFYAFLTGLCPSVCRSTLMFSLIMLGNVMSRKPFTYNTIFASFFILLLINPNWLFDVGFQLSYAAVLSIVYFQPKIRNLLIFKSKPMNWLWDLTTVSIAAQLGTMPIAQYYFQQFPNYFLIANYTTIPLSSIIIYSAMLLFAVYKVPIINVLASFVLEWSTKAMNFCVRFIENLPNALTFSWLDIWQMYIFYGVVFSIGVLFYKINFRATAAFLVFSILFVVSLGVQHIDNEKFSELVIFNDNKGVTLNIAQKNQNLVYATSQEDSEKYARAFWLHHACQEPEYQIIDTLNSTIPIVYDDKTFLILDDKNIYKKEPEFPLEVDYLIVTKNIFPKPELFEKYFSVKTLIINGDVYQKNAQKFEETAEKFNIKTFSVIKNGAFIMQGN